MICTTHDCARQSAMFLCQKCIIEMDDLLNEVPLLIAALDPSILAWSVTKPPGANRETRNTNKAGSQAPMNVDVDLLRDWLKSLVGHRAYDLAANYPNAGQYLHMARLWVDKANTVTHGAETPEIDHEANRERIKEVAPPMTTRHLIPWLRKNAKIAIMAKDIRNWAARGKLVPVERQPLPTYWPHEALQVHKETRE